MALHEVGSDLDNTQSLGNLSLNLANSHVKVDGESIDLAYQEMELLRLLFEQPERVVSYRDLSLAIWGNSEASTLRHLNVLAHRLRAKLAACQPYAIETVRGRGYGLLRAREARSSKLRST